jgi:predicted transglutaminase-like cysteine proteinase
MRKATLLFAVLCVLFAIVASVSAQQIHLPPSVSQSQSMGSPPITVGDVVQRQQAEAANQQRQVEIKRDTEKMFELTQELKDDLQKTGQAVLSLDDVKKADQIEKLAKSVKSKMKQSF